MKKKPAKSKSKPAPVAKKVKKPAQTELEMQEKQLADYTPAEVYGALGALLLKGFNSSNAELKGPTPLKAYIEHPPESFGFWKEASDSGWRAYMQSHRSLDDEIPMPLDEISFRAIYRLDHNTVPAHDAYARTVVEFLTENGSWLKACRKNIHAAIEKGDEDFFLRLGNLIRNRPKYRSGSLFAFCLGLRVPGDPPERFDANCMRRLLSFCWVNWGLWLMPDPVGCSYFCKFSKHSISNANYTKLRQQLQLFQHPKRPVIDFNEDGSFVIKPGWKNGRS